MTSVISDCPNTRLSIKTSKCGNCPNETANIETLVTCTDVYVDGNLTLCEFAVQAIICDVHINQSSVQLNVTLKGKHKHYFCMIFRINNL